jgi:starch synthase
MPNVARCAVYKDARTILAIHNMAHHGTEASTSFPNLSLPDEWYGGSCR